MPLLADELLHLNRADAEPPESLRPLLGPRVDRLSGVQLRLLNVWSCLGGEARSCRLDEPKNDVDPSTVRALAGLLRSARSDRAVLVVVHDARFLEGFSARILEMGR